MIHAEWKRQGRPAGRKKFEVLPTEEPRFLVLSKPWVLSPSSLGPISAGSRMFEAQSTAQVT